MDDTQLYDAQVGGLYDMFVWGWTPYVDPDPMLSYFTCDQVTYDVDEAGYNDANWCLLWLEVGLRATKVELDPVKRREIVAEMLKVFNRESTYLVLLQDADLQAYRTDRFEGWLRQPAGTGPVLCTNSSPTYENLRLIGTEPPPVTEGSTAPTETTPDGSVAPTETTPDGSVAPTATTPDGSAAPAATTPDGTPATSDDDDGSSTGLIVGIIAAIVIIGGGGFFLAKRRGTADDRD